MEAEQALAEAGRGADQTRTRLEARIAELNREKRYIAHKKFELDSFVHRDL